jgi:hypothetical protein
MNPRFTQGQLVRWEYTSLQYPKRHITGSGRVLQVYPECGNVPTNYTVEGHRKGVLFEGELVAIEEGKR